MATANISFELPPLPDYTLRPLPPLVSWLPDEYLGMVLLIVAYWTTSGLFHIIDEYDLFPQYRLHTPAEVMKRNHASRWEVFRDVIVQQAIQFGFGLVLAYFDEQAMCGKEDYDVAWWAQKIRLAQRALPLALTTVGLDVGGLSAKLSASTPTFAGALAGGRYPWLVEKTLIGGAEAIVPTFASWELRVAKLVYYVAVPLLQLLVAVIILDAWQYFWHRFMHTNRWMYTTIHSRHHRLYVPYAYGALYNHPFEGFLMDTLGSGGAYLITGMTIRQSMVFFTFATVKTVDDHCGYSLPFDPIQLISSNNAGYHDIHHQSWGIKTNFSQPFFIFWDSVCDTMWKGGDVSARYEKGRRLAQQKLEQDQALQSNVAETVTASTLEVDESVKTPVSARRSTRKKSSSISQTQENLKGLRNKMNESLHGRGGAVLGVERNH